MPGFNEATALLPWRSLQLLRDNMDVETLQ